MNRSSSISSITGVETAVTTERESRVETRLAPPKRTFLDRVSHQWIDRLTILAILAVVVTVSVPTLRGVARRENENDARATLALLSRHVASTAAATTNLAELVRQDDSLLLRLPDVEILRGERPLLRRHGYLFEALRQTEGKHAGEIMLRAWPWSSGESGSLVFACLSGAPPKAFVDAKAQFSGPFAPPPADGFDLPLTATSTSEVLAAPPQ